MMCANLNTGSAVVGKVAPYHIGDKQFKIFLGVLQIDNEIGKPNANIKNLENPFEHYTKSAPQYHFLDDDNHAFIALSHLGR